MSDMKFIDAGWLIDGSGGPVLKNVRIGTEKESIVSINESGFKDPSIKAADLSLCTILPPLVDSHVHLCMSGTVDPFVRKKQLDINFADAKVVISNHIAQHLSHGVLAVRDGGDKYAHSLRYLNECHDIMESPVKIKVSGKAWHKAGRYGGLIGRPPEKNCSLAQAIKNCSDKIDYIKIVNSGLNSLKEFSKETGPQFSIKELSDAVKIAERLGLKVMVHANGKKPVEFALVSGCHSIEHGFFMGDENLGLMAKKNIIWVPTACTMKAYLEHMEKKSVEYDVTCMNLEHQLKQIENARKYGVTVALGTDSGSTGVHHGLAVKEELNLLITAGYSVPEAVKCATFNGAELLGINEFGHIARGEPATFIAIEGMPSDIPSSLSSIKAIFINGRIRYSDQAKSKDYCAWD
ncbi:amidohydrolase family protein [Desulfobacterium sp. N47]